MVTLNKHPLPFLVPNMDEPSKPLALVIFPNSITLTSTNYISWKTQVEAILIGYDLRNHLHPALSTSVTNPNYQIWFRQDKLIFGALIGTISSDLVPLVSHAKTTHEMWDMLARSRGCVTLLKALLNDSKHTSIMQNKRKNSFNEDGQTSGTLDVISNLPNDILVYLLSFVDLKTAGRTSLLSRRWRCVWTHILDLNFEDPEFLLQWKDKGFSKQQDRYCRWVNQVISASRSPYLNTFTIHFPLSESYAADIDKWIEFSLRKNVCNLELNLSTLYGIPVGDSYTMCSDLLYICPDHHHHINLKSLHLESLSLGGPVLENILSHCVNLESLKIIGCQFYYVMFKDNNIRRMFSKDKILVSSSKLKHLELSRCYNVDSFQISTPNLASFVVLAGWKQEMKYDNVPSLVDVTFKSGYCNNIFHVLHVFSRFSLQLKKLSLQWDLACPVPTAFPALPNVEQLELAIGHPEQGDDNLLALTPYFEACPLLHTFKLKKLCTSREGIALSALKEDHMKAICAHRHLEVVEFMGFVDIAPITELTFCLSQHAPMLKKIIFDPHLCEVWGMLLKLVDQKIKDQISRARRHMELLASQIQGDVDVVVL